MSLEDHNAEPEVNALENALAGLCPQPSRINRDRLLFEAGREAEQARTSSARRLWPFSTGVAAVAAAAFGVLLLDARTHLAELQIALRERPAAAAVAAANAAEHQKAEQQKSERPATESEIPRVARQAPVSQAAPRSADGKVAVSESTIVIQSPTGGHGNYLALRNRALLLGIDSVADAFAGSMDHKAAGASDAPATNRDLRPEYFDRSVRQPAEFESFRRGLPVIDGERL